MSQTVTDLLVQKIQSVTLPDLLCQVIDKTDTGYTCDPLDDSPLIYGVQTYNGNIDFGFVEPKIGTIVTVSRYSPEEAYITDISDYQFNLLESEQSTIVRSEQDLLIQAKSIIISGESVPDKKPIPKVSILANRQGQTIREIQTESSVLIDSDNKATLGVVDNLILGKSDAVYISADNTDSTGLLALDSDNSITIGADSLITIGSVGQVSIGSASKVGMITVTGAIQSWVALQGPQVQIGNQATNMKLIMDSICTILTAIDATTTAPGANQASIVALRSLIGTLFSSTTPGLEIPKPATVAKFEFEN